MDDLSVTVRTRWLVIVGVVVVLAGVAGGVVWLRRARPEAVPATVVLQAATDPGTDPFRPVPSGRPIAVALPPSGTSAGVTATVDADSGVRAVSGTTERLYAGSTPGNHELYGGSGSLSACDPKAITAFLAAHPDKAAAWAQVRGIEPAAIPGYLDALTPVVLVHDTVVTNHGFAAGVATAFVSVLQAGTAVLVDATGLPVVRCACGNPLSAAPRVNLSTAQVDGDRWPGYDPDGALTVVPGSAVTEFVMVDVATGQDVTVAVGPALAPPTSTADAATTTAPTSVPPSSEADVGSCTLDLAWPEAAPGWIEPLDPSFTCQEMIDQWRRNEQWPGERGGTMMVVDFDDGWYCTGVHWDPTRPRTNAVGSCDLNGRRFNVYEGQAGVRTTVPTATEPSPTPETTTAPATSEPPADGVASDLLITPSGNIECALRAGQFACTIKQFNGDLGDERCSGERGAIVRLAATGPTQVSSCRGDFFDGITWPDPTPYGTTVKLGDVSCDVEETGVTCTNLDGHSFTLSRAGVR